VSHIFRKKADEDYKLRVWGFTEDIIGEEVGEELQIYLKLKITNNWRGTL